MHTCSAAAATPVPPADQATAAPEGCSAYRAYYGIGQAADFGLARACAFRERSASVGAETPFHGQAILAMLYANGRGVPRDIGLAIKFACEIEDGALAEKDGRVDHLLALRDHPEDSPFDLCDDITSGMMSGYCEDRDSELAEQARKRKIQDLLADASPSQRAAFNRLQNAAESYFSENADSTLGTGGTLRAAEEIIGVEQQRTVFVDTLIRLEKRERPKGMSGDFAEADRGLNQIYRQLLAWADPDAGILQKDLREAERAWIVYRDRWVDFAQLRYPDLPADQIKTLLTRQRTAAIDGVMHPGH